MPLNADALTLTLLAVLAALFIGIIGYAIARKASHARRERDAASVRATIVDYFRRSGVAVAADCLPGADGRYTVLVESEPMKRFRLSHIIEMTLREHVRKAAGVELDKIYWRFPVREAVQAAAVPAATTAAPGQATTADQAAAVGKQGKPAELSDEYINEGLEHYRHIPKPEVDELPWEAFEQVTTAQKKDSAPG